MVSARTVAAPMAGTARTFVASGVTCTPVEWNFAGSKHVGSATIYREIDNGRGSAPIGFDVVVTSSASGSVYADGSWAVTVSVTAAG